MEVVDEGEGSAQQMTVPGSQLYRTLVTAAGGTVAVAMVFVASP
jgi:hypothetical protein